MNRFHAFAAQLRRAARALVRRPVLSVVALLTLGLGLGASAAIFSLVDAVLLEPLPVRDPARLAMVWSTAPDQGIAEGLASYPDFDDWRTRRCRRRRSTRRRSGRSARWSSSSRASRWGRTSPAA